MVQEAARLRDDLDFFSVAPNVQPVERAQRTLRLARGGAERGEVVPAEQALGASVHRLGVQWRMQMPDASDQQSRARTAIQYAVTVAAPNRREPRIPSGRRGGGVQHAH